MRPTAALTLLPATLLLVATLRRDTAVTATSLDDSLSKFQAFLGKAVAEEFYHDLDTLAEVRHWTALISARALNETLATVEVVEDTHVPDKVEFLFGKPHPAPSSELHASSSHAPGLDIATALAILDTVYESASKVGDFDTPETFNAHYAPTLPRTILLAPATKATVYGGSMLNLLVDNVRKKASLPQQALPWLVPRCETFDVEYFHSADRTIFYNSLAAGLAGIAFSGSGTPGLPAIPGALPTPLLVNYVSTLSIQLHMLQSLAAAAHLDPSDDAVRTMIYLCLVADGASSSFGRAAKNMAELLAHHSVDQVPAQLIHRINRKVGTKLVRKFAVANKEKGALVTLGGIVPLIGKVVGFVVDAGTTWSIGKVGKYVFCPQGMPRLVPEVEYEVYGVEESVKNEL
ncbi:hypothetical protein BC938DRAFT_475694 [Jimgerdemannia flammicorona]|uniref:Uncharacterized protein n=1 Tax=Jimgerdemannia flammicorona TaxID=994334 RepID=A0A433QRC4_9FUNG|nr:hypothetical protein BC938DRAFT_475694 [Jimgerdemannia flammicorona]